MSVLFACCTKLRVAGVRYMAKCLIGAPGVASDYVHHPVSRAFMAELRLGCTGWVETVVPFFCRIGALSNHAATFNPRRFVNPTTYIGWRSGLRIALVERSLQGVHTVVSALIRSTFPVSIPHAVDSLFELHRVVKRSSFCAWPFVTICPPTAVSCGSVGVRGHNLSR